MAKQQTAHVCQVCGASFPKWAGQCSQCGEWNSLVEEVVATTANTQTARAGKKPDFGPKEHLVSLGEVLKKPQNSRRISTHSQEFDRVLGGEVGETEQGMVPGAVMLLGGEPGIGKSTLLSQLAVQCIIHGSATKKHPVVYVCGEESPSQITLRLTRILESAGKNTTTDGKKLNTALQFVTTTQLELVLDAIGTLKPSLIIIDSIQTIRSAQLTGAAGSIGQVRECADELASVAKALNVPLFMVGHVTKDGSISGPKVLEHIVDSVLELSGERTGELRLLRALKNRFGATDEVGVFRVTNGGYEGVDNPSAFLLEQTEGKSVGSAVVCIVEGTRPLLLEVQALVVKSQLAMPRRVGRGVELSRIQVLSAVLQKHTKLPLATSDIFLSIAGGFSVKEPAIDLGAALAVASSLKNKPLPDKTVCIGEVGLLGEIRTVPFLDRRIKEAKRLGYTNIISRKTHKNIASVVSSVF